MRIIYSMYFIKKYYQKNNLNVFEKSNLFPNIYYFIVLFLIHFITLFSFQFNLFIHIVVGVVCLFFLLIFLYFSEFDFYSNLKNVLFGKKID
jgi:hypothetical protein